jgi:hypothetical protein
MSVVLVMCMLWPSRAQELDGRQCQGIGDKTGRAIHTSMDKAFLLLSQPATDAVWSHTMLLQLVGPSDRHILEANIATKHPLSSTICIVTPCLLEYDKIMVPKSYRLDIIKKS